MAGRKKDNLIYGVGYTKGVAPITYNGKKTKEYETWRGILKRCYDNEYLLREPTYNDCVVADEWLCYENFYNWIISQENYEKWKIGGREWALDKDVIYKGNKLYSKETCFLVPRSINGLFTNRKLHRGKYPIGVDYLKRLNKFRASCMNPFIKKQEHIGTYSSSTEAFKAYKEYKENIIKLVAQQEFKNGSITEKCMLSMLNYRIEIDD